MTPEALNNSVVFFFKNGNKSMIIYTLYFPLTIILSEFQPPHNGFCPIFTLRKVIQKIDYSWHWTQGFWFERNLGNAAVSRTVPYRFSMHRSRRVGLNFRADIARWQRTAIMLRKGINQGDFISREQFSLFKWQRYGINFNSPFETRIRISEPRHNAGSLPAGGSDDLAIRAKIKSNMPTCRVHSNVSSKLPFRNCWQK